MLDMLNSVYKKISLATTKIYKLLYITCVFDIFGHFILYYSVIVWQLT